MADYGIIDRCTGGAATADQNSAGHLPSAAFDDNDSTYWERTGTTALPAWLKYDFGAGVTWAIGKMTALLYATGGCSWRAFTVNGSNNDSNWTELASLEAADSAALQTFTWINQVKYRYIKIIITSDYRGADNYCSTYEVSMYELLPSGSGFFIFLCEAWRKHNKLWKPKGLIIPKDLGFQM